MKRVIAMRENGDEKFREILQYIYIQYMLEGNLMNVKEMGVMWRK